MGAEIKVNTFAAADVKSLRVDMAVATVRVKGAADGEIRVEARNLREGRYTCELGSGKLTITYKPEKTIHFCRSSYEGAQIVLYVPANHALEQAALKIGAGEMSMDVPVLCSEMKVGIGAGKWKAAHLTVSDCLKVDIGAGKAKMKEVTAGRVDIDCGVGTCIYKGRINGDTKVGCGMGNCSFQLENRQSDFNYDVSCAMGSVRINGNKIKNLSAKRDYRSETALGTAILECGLGNIEWSTNGIETGTTK